MKNGWPVQTLAEVCELKPAKSEARERVAAHAAVSFLPMEDLGIGQKFLRASQERRMAEVVGSYTYFADGDVLLAKITPCFENGKLGIAEGLTNGIGFGSSEYVVLRPHAGLSKEWLYYYLSREVFREEGAARMTGAVGHKRVPKEFIEAYPIPVPPLAEQQRIVSILDEAFEGIASAGAGAERNLANARALFESELNAVFTRRDEGWMLKTIGDACTLKSGTTVPVAIERASGDIPYVKVAEMTLPANRDGITTSVRFLNQSDIKAGWIIPVGSVIFPKRGGAILTNKKRLTLVDICVDLNIMSVIPSEQLIPEFLYLYFLNVDMRKLGTGSSIPQINNYDIAPLLIQFPESKVKQKELTEVLRAIEVECQTLESIYERKVEALDALKKSLLHEAFSGNL